MQSKEGKVILIKKTLTCATLFAILDSLWFSFFMKDFAQDSIALHLRFDGGSLETNYLAALIAYLLMIIMAVMFLSPVIESKGSNIQVVSLGFIFGFCLFGVFDFTNVALMNNYPWNFALIDSSWGGVMYSIVGLSLKKLT
jgi:uncharacterized membrane protein